MSFIVRLGADLISVEPGSTIPFSIEIANRSETQDRYELEIEGLDPEWTAVPVPSFTVDRNDLHNEKVFFKPPRVSESLAGNYPFVVKVRSLESGEVRTAQAVLEIKPFHHMSMEIDPKKASLSGRADSMSYELTLINLGNHENTMQLFGSDIDDLIVVDFEEGTVTIGPGQTKIIQAKVTPTARNRFASPRLHALSFSARSVDVPSVVCSTQAHLEVRPLLSSSALVAVVFALILFIGWFALLPKPPTVDSLMLSTVTPTKGDVVTVTWEASNAKGVRITLNGLMLEEAGSAKGSKTFVASESGTVSAVAFRDGRESEVRNRSYEVSLPLTYPDPEITQFDVSSKSLRFGETFVVRYKFSDSVVRATLAPNGIVLDPKLDSVTVEANVTGKVTYTIVAENADGKTTRKDVVVTVVDSSEATIVKFAADKESLDFPGSVMLTWQLTKAERIELNDGQSTILLDSPAGTRDVFIEKTTEFTITGYDAQGKKVSQKVTVRVKPIDSPTASPVGVGTTTGGGGI
ncbi:MAG: hypothetical protein KF784_04800 [Fimbriimonadaceae bacterium]|nr:hypothetical protein [Fimbriimonadaceae bacterium]